MINTEDYGHASRGFARLPQRMSLHDEWHLQEGIARRAVARMKEIGAQLGLEPLAPVLPLSGLALVASDATGALFKGGRGHD